MLAFLIQFSLALFVSVAIHEMGHVIATRLHGHDIEEAKIDLFLGLFASAGWAVHDVDPNEDRSLRAALHIDTGGVTATTLVGILGLPALAYYVLMDWAVPLAPFVATFYISVVWSILQAVPAGGSDGDHFQRDVLRALGDRHSWVPSYQTVYLALLGLFGLMVFGAFW